MNDNLLRDSIIAAYREGRRGFIRVGQLLEDKRQELGGTSRGGTPVKSKFWKWFEEQEFPFSRNTAENYLLFARDPGRYEMHCERVRRRARRQNKSEPTSGLGLESDIYHALVECAYARHHSINQEVEEAVILHLRMNAPDLLAKVTPRYRGSESLMRSEVMTVS